MSQEILITGGTGLIGKDSSEHLSKLGFTVRHLSRKNNTENRIFWNPDKGILNKEYLKNKKSILHLAGENIGSGRWTKKKKKRISESRIQTTQLLFQKLQELSPKERPESFISASAVGFYGSREDELLTEESVAGTGFLSKTVIDWEHEAKKISELGIRTVILRFGMVLSPNGGALDKMIPPIRFFLGSALGSGKQYISWIHIHDLSRIIAAAVQKNEIKGIYNAVSPDTVTNLQMIQVLAQCLNRPVILPPVPSFLLKILLGDMSEIVLDGQMVSSEKIQKEGFEFTYPSLEKALKNILLNGKK